MAYIAVMSVSGGWSVIRWQDQNNVAQNLTEEQARAVAMVLEGADLHVIVTAAVKAKEALFNCLLNADIPACQLMTITDLLEAIQGRNSQSEDVTEKHKHGGINGK